MNRLPGWDKHSYGYHGDDGHSFCSSGTGQPYGPTFTTGDVIGCCVNLIDNTCFYTKNGVHLGIAFRDLPVSQQLCSLLFFPIFFFCSHLFQRILMYSTRLRLYQCINSFRPSDAYIRHQPRASLVLMVASCLASAKPLSEPMLEYCKLDPW